MSNTRPGDLEDVAHLGSYVYLEIIKYSFCLITFIAKYKILLFYITLLSK